MPNYLSIKAKLDPDERFPRSNKLQKLYSDELFNPKSDFWQEDYPDPKEREYHFGRYKEARSVWDAKILGLIEHFDNDYQMLNSNAAPPSIQHKYYELTIAWNDYLIGNFFEALRSCSRSSIEKYEDELLQFYTEVNDFNKQVAQEIIDFAKLKDIDIVTSCSLDDPKSKHWDIKLRNKFCNINSGNPFGLSLTRDDMKWFLGKSDALHIPSCKDLYRKRIARKSYVKDRVIHSLLRQGFSFTSIRNALCYFASLINDLYDFDNEDDFRYIDSKRLTKNQRRCIKNWFLDIDNNPTKFWELVKGTAGKAQNDYDEWIENVEDELFEIACLNPYALNGVNLELTFNRESPSSKAGFHFSLLQK